MLITFKISDMNINLTLFCFQTKITFHHLQQVKSLQTFLYLISNQYEIEDYEHSSYVIAQCFCFFSCIYGIYNSTCTRP